MVDDAGFPLGTEPKDAMATTTKRSRAKVLANATPENATESEIIARAILHDYSDLAPSVNRIMQSDLDEPGRLKAITLFRDSLAATGDPMRNPANAIEAGRLAS